jgi:hypothetical protein
MCVELTRIVKTSSVTPSSVLSPSWKNLSGVSCLDILRLLQVYIDLRSRHRGKGYRYHLHTPGFPFARWADLGCTTNYLVKWSFTHPLTLFFQIFILHNHVFIDLLSNSFNFSSSSFIHSLLNQIIIIIIIYVLTYK